MSKQKFKIDWYGKNVSKETRAEVSKKVRQATFLVQADAIENVPVDEGVLKGSIDTEILPFKGAVYSNKEYAPYVELGTAPHWIGGPVKIKGKWVYIGMHPGTAAQPYLGPALFDNEQNIKRIFNDNKL